LRRESEAAAQVLVSAAHPQANVHGNKNPPEDRSDDKGDKENGQIEAEVLVGPPLGKSQKGDGTEAGGEHGYPHHEPVHFPAAYKVVLVVLLPPGALDSQGKDNSEICNANEPIQGAEFQHR